MSHVWPPPGTSVVPVAHPENWGLICGDLDTLPSGMWYVTTLSQFALELPAEGVSVLLAAARLFTGPIALAYGTVGQWPVIYKQGEGRTMRWIKSTMRGTLGAVEQFQFGINWGQPGSDPDLTPAQCATLAASIAAKWQTVWNTTTFGTGGAAFSSQYPTDVKFTEVGVVMLTQTEGTDSDGGGGNLEQAEETEWAPINGVAGVVGTGSSASLPYEVSQAITLHTDKRGPSGRGRLYFPPLCTQYVTGGGLYDVGAATAAGKAIGRLFELVTTAHSHVPVVVSRRRIVLNEVKSVTCGKVPDSQRRRRWAQDEAPIIAWTKP